MGETLQEEQEVETNFSKVFKKIQGLASELLEIDPDTITEETKFVDIDLDSLDKVQVVGEVEDEFGVIVNKEDLGGAETVASFALLYSAQLDLLDLAA